MEILKEGHLLETYEFTIEEIYTLKCKYCNTEFECDESELDCFRNVHERGIDNIYTVDCPLCNKKVLAYVCKCVDISKLFKCKKEIDYFNDYEQIINNLN